MASDKKIDIIIGAKDQASAVLGRLGISFTELNQATELARKGFEVLKAVWNATIVEAAESQAIYMHLAGQIEALGYHYNQVRPRIESYTEAIQENTRFTDEQAAAALQLASIHVDTLDKAIGLTTAGIKIASRNGQDLDSVMQSLGMAIEGAGRGAKRYGLEVSSAATEGERYRQIVEQTNKLYSKAIQADMDTYITKITSLKNMWSELGEQFGNSAMQMGLDRILTIFTAIAKLEIKSKSEELKQWMEILGQGEKPVIGPVNQTANEALENYDKTLLKCHTTAQVFAAGERAAAIARAEQWFANSRSVQTYYSNLLDVSNMELTAGQELMSQMTEQEETRRGILQREVDDFFKSNNEIIADMEKTMIESGKFTAKQIADLVKGTRLAVQSVSIVVDNLGRHLIDAMFGARLNLQEVWKGIAKDFMLLFLEEVERAIAKAVIKWVAKLALFDQHENDMVAMKSGRDYARFFLAGVDTEFAGSNLTNKFNSIGASRMTGAGHSSNITINIINPIGTREYVRDNIVPEIEKLATRLETSIVIKEASSFA